MSIQFNFSRLEEEDGQKYYMLVEKEGVPEICLSNSNGINLARMLGASYEDEAYCCGTFSREQFPSMLEKAHAHVVEVGTMVGDDAFHREWIKYRQRLMPRVIEFIQYAIDNDIEYITWS